jgi:hypothetical protein
MNKFLNMLGRLGLLAVALALCALKLLYTGTLEIHETGGGAFYNLMVYTLYVVMTTWTVLLVLLVLSTGAASVNDMGSLKFIHTSYFLVMAFVAGYSFINDVLAVIATSGAHTVILLVQMGLEAAIVLSMLQQLRSAFMSIGQRAVDATHDLQRR